MDPIFPSHVSHPYSIGPPREPILCPMFLSHGSHPMDPMFLSHWPSHHLITIVALVYLLVTNHQTQPIIHAHRTCPQCFEALLRIKIAIRYLQGFIVAHSNGSGVPLDHFCTVADGREIHKVLLQQRRVLPGVQRKPCLLNAKSRRWGTQTDCQQRLS